MAGPKSKINQNCKLLENADDVAVYSVSRQQIRCIGGGKWIQITGIYLQESGLEIAPKECQLFIFDKIWTAKGKWEIMV
jgi:hypothetical protein